MRWSPVPAVLAALLAIARPAAADPEADARAHFLRGVALVEQRAFAEALTEFTLSRRLFPTWKASKNVAACLGELGRYDEALDALEALGRDFPDLPSPATDEIAAAAAALRERVGIVAVEEGEPGASVVIDDRDRGELPAAAAVRVVAGSHVVRLAKDGFEPTEALVVVPAGQRVTVRGRLRALENAGRLRVAEEQGRTAAVFVDGREVGRTPWEGTVTAGDHLVWLQGADDLGTPPALVHVAARARTSSRLAATRLAARARIAATPSEARITLDGVPLGPGPWSGRLTASAHHVEASAEGYLPVRREVQLATGADARVDIALEQDPFAPRWRRSVRFVAELSAAPLLGPGFGGALGSGCTAGCTTGPVLGGRGLLHVGMALGSGLSFGLTAGGLAADERTTARPTTLAPIGLPDTPGVADDTRKLRAFMGGAWGAYSFGTRAILRLRLGAGAIAGSLGDSRTGVFQPASAPAYSVGPLGDAHRALFVFVEPEIRAGLRLTRDLELTAGLGALLLFDLARPTWDAKQQVRAGSDGLAFFAAETLASPVSVLFAPGIALRYER